jgi:hypothetical protein
MLENDEIVAHASMLCRVLKATSQSKSFNLALVGNVATAPSKRGQGLQKIMMDHLKKTAEAQNVDAIVLWSDLNEFYQKLGFSSNGMEFRFRIKSTINQDHSPLPETNPKGLTTAQLSKLLQSRPTLAWCIQRSPDEFLKLLCIPDTHLFVSESTRPEREWLVIGKGSDMQGVVHEWGGGNPEGILRLMNRVMLMFQLPELILLAPSSLNSKWLATYKSAAQSYEQHPMCLIKIISHRNDVAQALAQSFIWGLDSI